MLLNYDPSECCCYRNFACAVLHVFRRLTLAACVVRRQPSFAKCMHQEKQVFVLSCFVSSLINSPGWSKWCDFSECIAELSTDYVLCKGRWQGWIKDRFLNGALYSYTSQEKVPETTSLEAKTLFQSSGLLTLKYASLMEGAY